MLQKYWQNWLSKRFQFTQHKQLSQRDVLVFIYQQGYLYLVLIVITFIAGVNYANNLILGFCFLISAVLCISFYLTFKQLHGLTVELVADEVGQVGQALQLHFYFHQPLARSRYLYIQVNQQRHQVLINQHKQHFTLSFYAEQRGQFKYPVMQIYALYPFGLVRAWTYFYHQKSSWIAPKPQYLATDNKSQQHHFEPDMDEFRELRNYQSGESLHAVSWKQVARGQGLYIKVFEQFQQQNQSIEIHYAHMPSPSHEERLALMMGLVAQCEQQQLAYSLHLPHTQLALGMGSQQLLQAKLLLAQA